MAAIPLDTTDRLYTTPHNHPYFCPTPGKITLLAITPNKIGTIPDGEGLYDELAQCGFNAASIFIGSIGQTQLAENSQLSDTIQYARDNNIALFIYSSTLDNTSALRTNLVKYFSSNSNLAGWWLISPLFHNIHTVDSVVNYNKENSTNTYNEIWNIERNTDGGNPESTHMIIMNTHPNAESAGADNYRNYMIRFQDNIYPSVWGTIVYPSGITAAGVKFNNYDLFFGDLEIYSLVSKYCERPFWFDVICQSYMNENGSQTGTPSIEEMRFCAFSALAYGAQGLMFWAYRLREDEVSNGVTQVKYLTAPVDRNGNKITTIWNAVQTVNKEIAALNEVFYESYLVEVRHTGSKQYMATSMLDGPIGPLLSITTDSAGVLVSHINTHGQDYLIIVNHSFRDEDADYQSIELNFAENVSIKSLTVSGTSIVATTLSSSKQQKKLPRGGYLIFSWIL